MTRRLERSIVVLFFLFLLSFPPLVQAYGTWHFFVNGVGFSFVGITEVSLETALAALQFFRVLNRHFCPRCVNFSCPFNRESEETEKKYLEKNPAVSEKNAPREASSI